MRTLQRAAILGQPHGSRYLDIPPQGLDNYPFVMLEVLYNTCRQNFVVTYVIREGPLHKMKAVYAACRVTAVKSQEQEVAPQSFKRGRYLHDLMMLRHAIDACQT